MLLGKGIMINWANVAPQDRTAYDTWHCHEHTVGRVAIPGFCRGRRYIAVDTERATRDFLTMYEVDDLSVLTGADYLAKANNPSPLTRATTPVIKNSVRGLSRVRASFGDAAGGAALTLRFGPLAGCEGELERFLVETALPRIAKRPDMCGAHLIVADQDASKMTPVERQGRPTEIPNWIVLLEGFRPDAVVAAGDAELGDATLAAHGCAPGVERDSYLLQFLVPKTHAA